MATGILQMWLRLWTIRWGNYPGLSEGLSIITLAFKSREHLLAEVREIWQHEKDPTCSGWLWDVGPLVQEPERGPGSQGQSPADNQQGNRDLSPTAEWNWVRPTAWMSLETDSPLEPPEENAAQPTPWFQHKAEKPAEPTGLLTYRTVR